MRDEVTSWRGDYIRSDGPGFLPGHASLAYFFLFGSLDVGSDDTAGWANSTLTRELTGASAGSMGADKSTSGAGLGIRGSPSLEARVEEKRLEDAD